MNSLCKDVELNDLASVQGELFRYINHRNYDYREFVETYMNSKFCNLSMDAEFSYVQYMEPEEMMPFLNKEWKGKLDPFMKRPIDITMYYIGYMYRYISRKYGIASKSLYRKVPLDDMEKIITSHSQDHEIADIEKAIIDRYKFIKL